MTAVPKKIVAYFDMMMDQSKWSGVFFLDTDVNFFCFDLQNNGRQSSVSGFFALKIRFEQI